MQAWRKRPNTLLVRYEDMSRAPLATVTAALRIMGLSQER